MAKLYSKQLEQLQYSTSIELGQIPDSKHAAAPERCEWSNCNKTNCRTPWHRPHLKTNVINVVEKLRPALVYTGLAKVVFGGTLLILVETYAADLNSLYGVGKSQIVSLSSVGGLMAVVFSGLVLVISVLWEKRTALWFYIIASAFLCMYIFGMAVIMIQYGLYNVPMVSMKNQDMSSITSTNSSETNQPDQLSISGLTAPYTSCENNVLLSRACVIGFATLLGSVFYFIGTVTVFVYYNLKYISCVP